MNNYINNKIIPLNPKPFTGFCRGLGMIPTNFDDSLSYNEQLIWLYKYITEILNKAIIDDQNAIIELQNLQSELKDYVDNYFTNLDVQEEINNKLDLLVEDGTLEKLINDNILIDIKDNISQIEVVVDNLQKLNITSTPHPKISCYGDSNTAFYLGDSSSFGPNKYSYPSYLGFYIRNFPFLFNSQIRKVGYPGETVFFGLENFDWINKDYNIVILGFGTNDIKNINTSLEDYINAFSQILDKAEKLNVVPIVLGIPPFEYSFVNNSELYDRLPIWNKALRDLCNKRNVLFLDTYNLFKGNLPLFMNETSTPKRHYSEYANSIIAYNLTNLIANSISNKKESLVIKGNNISSSNIFNLDFEPSTLNFNNYQFSNYPQFNTFKLSQNNSLSFTNTRICLLIYPRANSTVEMYNDSTLINTTEIIPTLEDGTYFPYQFYYFNNVNKIKVVSGELYIIQINLE